MAIEAADVGVELPSIDQVLERVVNEYFDPSSTILWTVWEKHSAFPLVNEAVDVAISQIGYGEDISVIVDHALEIYQNQEFIGGALLRYAMDERGIDMDEDEGRADVMSKLGRLISGGRTFNSDVCRQAFVATVCAKVRSRRKTFSSPDGVEERIFKSFTLPSQSVRL